MPNIHDPPEWRPEEDAVGASEWNGAESLIRLQLSERENVKVDVSRVVPGTV